MSETGIIEIRNLGQIANHANLALAVNRLDSQYNLKPGAEEVEIEAIGREVEGPFQSITITSVVGNPSDGWTHELCIDLGETHHYIFYLLKKVSDTALEDFRRERLDGIFENAIRRIETISTNAVVNWVAALCSAYGPAEQIDAARALHNEQFLKACALASKHGPEFPQRLAARVLEIGQQRKNETQD